MSEQQSKLVHQLNNRIWNLYWLLEDINGELDYTYHKKASISDLRSKIKKIVRKRFEILGGKDVNN